MALPAPHLDDRRFQDLVDDAKRLVQRRCPEWTDHNVSDPGVTLIEAVAGMCDQLIYRLNRVPDRLYVKFLELIGVRLRPPTAARCELTFWLAAAPTTPTTVPAGTEAATLHGDDGLPPVVFATDSDLLVPPARLSALYTVPASGPAEERLVRLNLAGFPAFSTPPVPGDTLLVGLDHACPSNLVVVELDCRLEGIGVDPRQPPLVWEAFDGAYWQPCEVEEDSTGGLNRPGEVVLHVPSGHVPAVLERERAGWLRCRLVEPLPRQPFYVASPLIEGARAFAIGGSVAATHAERVRGEVLGVSAGTPGQRFALRERPVVAAETPRRLEVLGPEGIARWEEVEDFAESGPDDPHFVVDAVAGEVVFGPAVRGEDGDLVCYGAIPPAGATLRMVEYRTGGGRRGNVAVGAVQVLKSAVPSVARVTNRQPGRGGVDAEDVDAAKVRGPIGLRSAGRAVTAEDFEQLAREAAPGVGRVHCVAAESPEEAGGVRLLVVPAVADEADGHLPFERLVPPEDVLARIAERLDRCRLLGTRLVVEPPTYQAVTVVAALVGVAGAAPAEVRAAALAGLYRYLHPLRGGPEGTGWPFGRPVTLGDLYGLLQRAPGVDRVEEVRLFAADPLTGERGPAVPRVPVGPHTLVVSQGHEVRVESEA